MDRAQMQWENYKMRQAHVWKSFDRLILAVVSLWAIPFIKIELLDYKLIIYFFPVIALFLSYSGKRLLKAEYNRLLVVFEKLKDEDPLCDFAVSKSGDKINSNTTPGQIGRIMIKGICTWLIALSWADLLFIVLKATKIVKHL